MAAVVAQESTELPCVLIPLSDAALLLPNVCVAEILPWRRIRALPDIPPWCLGLLGWRGETVPVVRFEKFNDAQFADRKMGRCMVIMNRTRYADGIPFYAIAAEGLPRMLQLAGDDLANVPGKLGDAEVASLRVGTETAVIPNLEMLERSVSELKRSIT